MDAITFMLLASSLVNLLLLGYCISHVRGSNDRHQAVSNNLARLFKYMQKLDSLENLFVKYEHSVLVASEAAEQLALQQGRLEKVYQFNNNSMKLIKKIAQQRGIR